MEHILDNHGEERQKRHPEKGEETIRFEVPDTMMLSKGCILNAEEKMMDVYLQNVLNKKKNAL